MHHKLHDFFFAHEGNGHHPHVLRPTAIMAIALIVVLIEGLYFLSTTLLCNKGSFVASVLPAAIVGLTNTDRESRHISPVSNDTLLAQAAQEKADDMAARGYFSHTAPDGTLPWYWFDKVGYKYTYAGENLAVDFTDSKDVEDAWIQSPTHYANIIKPQYTRMGVGVSQGMYQGHETTFVVTFFAATPSDDLPLMSSLNRDVAAAAPPMPPKARVVAMRDEKPRVLGIETSAVAATGVVLATSPQHMTEYIFVGLLAMVVLSLVFALFTHARKRYWEIAGGAVLLILLILGFIVHNRLASSLIVASQGVNQAASVVVMP